MKTMESGGSSTRIMVQKADLPIKAGESIHEFTDRLRKDVIRHFQKMGLSKKIQHLWIDEIYYDKVIVTAMWKRPEKEGIDAEVALGDRDTYYQIACTKSDDVFEFGDTIEVERKVTWIPKARVEKIAPPRLWGGAIIGR